MDRTSHLRDQIAAEAAEWFARVRDASEGARAREEFSEWLLRSPAHIEEFLAVTRTWGDLEFPSGAVAESQETAQSRYSVETLVASALESREPDNIVPLLRAQGGAGEGAPEGVTEGGPRSEERPRRGGRVRLYAVAASVMLAAVGAGLWWWMAAQGSMLTTAVGEQRSLLLADGSTVELNSRSRIRVRFTETERMVELVSGQGLFRVAKDPARPFIVHSQGTQVRAVGTQFDVYRKSAGTIVTVLEGTVAVSAEKVAWSFSAIEVEPSLIPPPVLLTAGEQVTVTPERVERPKPTNLAIATAWRQRQMIFDSTPLADVAQEFNRYNERQLIVSRRELDHIHVSGVFSSADPASLLRFLRDQPDLRIEEADNEIRIVPARGPTL